LFAAYRYHAIFTDDDEPILQAEATHRDHAIIEQVIADLKNSALAHLPSGHFGANSAWLVCAAIAHNLTRAAGALAGEDANAAARTEPGSDVLGVVAVRLDAAHEGPGAHVQGQHRGGCPQCPVRPGRGSCSDHRQESGEGQARPISGADVLACLPRVVPSDQRNHVRGAHVQGRARETELETDGSDPRVVLWSRAAAAGDVGGEIPPRIRATSSV
jgi:hypothetical protein